MLIQFALTLTVLLGFCGLALDVGMMELTKLKLQNAADAAALGSLPSLGKGAGLAAAISDGKSDANLNGFTDGSNGTIISAAQPTTGLYANNTSAIQFNLTQQVNPIFFPGTRTVTASATAIAPPYAAAYLLSAYSTQPSINADNDTIQGSANIYLGRSYYFNSGSSSTGYQYLISNTSTASNQGLVSPSAISVPSTQDPLAGVPAYSGNCQAIGNQSITSSQTLYPGNYCGNISIAGSSSSNPITLNLVSGGTYSVAGSVSVNHAIMNGTNVMFYMAQQTGYSGVWNFSDTVLNLSAQTAGSWKGILFFADRTLPTVQQSGTIELSFNYVNLNTGSLDGIIYLPHQHFSSSNSNLKGNAYFGLVADWFSLNNSTLNLGTDYSSIGGNPFQPTGGGLVQ